MKKILIVLIIIGVCAANLLANDVYVFRHPTNTGQYSNCQYGVKTCFDKSKYHTGIDYHNGSDVFATNFGKVVHVENMHTGDHGMGNNIIIEHALIDGSKIYSTYVHLDSIELSIKQGAQVVKGQKLGGMGGSGYGELDYWSVHLHFEMKDGATTSNSSGSGQYWGYTPNHPDNYGYHNPDNYIGIVSVQNDCLIDIKANGSDGPLTLSSNDSVSLTVSLNSGIQAGKNADWWLVRLGPAGEEYCFSLVTNSWVYTPEEISPTIKGPLFDFDSIQLMKLTNLMVGTYYFYFAVDTVPNGKVDGELDETLFFDVVEVDYQPVEPTDSTLTNSLGMTFASIPAGTFMMGSPEDDPGWNNTETQHQVTLTQGYYMQTTEVTQGQWETVMGSNPSYFSSCGSDCPVETVSWYDAQEFINKLNQKGEGTYALPTEAQWEYAVRAGSTTAFVNGGIITATGCGYYPNLDDMGWYCYNSDSTTHPVTKKTPNAWGLYDMQGNVLEWCQDYWSSYYTSESVTDSTGPSSGGFRVLRGGSWYHGASGFRSASRAYSPPGGSNDVMGFRLVLLDPSQQ
jgi:formylglycine-generating enzyme required for sulfatase activity